MSEIPTDLLPLPTMPYDERPSELPLDVEECRTAIWRSRGNISTAAAILKVNSNRLRAFVKRSPRLSAEVQEALECLVDIAQDNILDALTDQDDAARRDQMSRFVASTIGKSRGFGTAGAVNINSPKGPIVIQWGDGSSISGPAPGDNAVDVTSKVVNG